MDFDEGHEGMHDDEEGEKPFRLIRPVLVAGVLGRVPNDQDHGPEGCNVDNAAANDHLEAVDWLFQVEHLVFRVAEISCAFLVNEKFNYIHTLT